MIVVVNTTGYMIVGLFFARVTVDDAVGVFMCVSMDVFVFLSCKWVLVRMQMLMGMAKLVFVLKGSDGTGAALAVCVR